MDRSLYILYTVLLDKRILAQIGAYYIFLLHNLYTYHVYAYQVLRVRFLGLSNARAEERVLSNLIKCVEVGVERDDLLSEEMGSRGDMLQRFPHITPMNPTIWKRLRVGGSDNESSG